MDDLTNNSWGGIKISNLCLLNPRFRNNTSFKIVIKQSIKTNETPESVASHDNTCVVWNEPLSFAGIISDYIFFTVVAVRIKIFSPKNISIGSCKHRVIDLLKMQGSSGSCKLEVAGKFQLTFTIEKISELDVLSGMVEKASTRSLPTQTAPAKAIMIIKGINPPMQVYNDNEKIWSSFIDTFQAFMKVMDGVSEINVYLKVAWNILSIIPKTIIAKQNRNDKVKQLCERLKDIYEYITDAERLHELFATTQSATRWSMILSTIVRQTIECAYFIRAYSKENPVKNVMKGISGSVDDKIQSFNDKLDHFMKVMTDSINLEIGVVTLRVSEKIVELNELILLGEMPYDSEAGFFPSKECLPGTRQTLINEIFEWVNGDASSQILVLSGQAGIGKSAVAHTIAGILQKQNRLGSMFCFNRSFKNRRDCLFSTISRDLADSDTLWREELVKVINSNSAVRRKKDVKTQYEELILKPSKNVVTIGPVVIVVDALDESGTRSEREEILTFLFERWSELPESYRIIITTRPEQDIEAQIREFNIPCKRMGDIDAEETRRDIEAYVSKRLDKISPKLDEIDKGWRSVLSTRAEGLFQWAQTACQFIDPTVTRSRLVGKKWETCISNSSSSLYGLYHQIISSQSEFQDVDFIEEFKTIVGAIITAREPLSINALQNIFNSIEDIESILAPFGSFFVGVHNTSIPVQPVHTSLFDFFASKQIGEETNEYYIDTSNQGRMTMGCLKLMNQKLRFNICNLETSHLRNCTLPGFHSRVEKAIPLHLSYSCRFWGFHLQSSAHNEELVREIRRLMDNKLLYYFEVLSLLAAVDRGCVTMREIMNWCKDGDGNLAADAMDTWEFGFDFGDTMTESTPHLYLSCLPFTPTDSFVSRQYLLRYPRLFTFDVGQPISSTHENGITQRHTSAGTPVALAFSPKGRYIATGSDRGDFWVWDYLTGDRLVTKIRSEYVNHRHRPFNHCRGVSNVVFSPDGELIYCCFYGGDILVWNMITMLPTIEKYKEAGVDCHFCTISSDGCFIVWCTNKDTHVFDRKSHRIVETFKRRFTFTSAAISPKGDWIALYRNPKDDQYLYVPIPMNSEFSPRRSILRMQGATDVHIWNTRNYDTLDVVSRRGEGDLALTDNYIAFQNISRSIEIRDLRRNTIIEIKCETRSPSFHFSPDDQYLLSTSQNVYSIWNVSTGELVSQSHVGDRIFCMGFSHDSQSIALRTPDGAIHVREWDKSTETSHSRGPDIQGIHEIWLRGAYLILKYWNTFHRCHLQISDIGTNMIVFDVELSESNRLVSVSPDEKNVRVAYVNARSGLCLWGEEGEIVVCGPDYPSFAHLCLGKYLIFTEHETIKIWDIRTNQIKSEVPSSCCLIIINGRANPLISVRDTQFAILEGNEGGVWECESGDKVAQITLNTRFFFNMTLVCSASGEYIICMSEKDVNILDASTGARVALIQSSRHDTARRLSPNGKYLTWTSDDEVILLNTDTRAGVWLKEPSLRQPIEKLWFSNDVNFMITASNADIDKKTGLLNIWDMQSKNTIIKSIRYPFNPENIENLVLSNRYLADSIRNSSQCSVWDLDTYETMSTLYSAPPVTGSDASDGSGTEGTPVSNKTEILDYALMAWNKASLPAFAHMDNGWVLGLQGELLFWVPENKRKQFWFPCMMHIPHPNITKLNFTNFVHGSNWAKCRSRDD